GDFEVATALVYEDNAIKHATGAQNAPYGAMLLAAYRGRVDEARTLIATTTAESIARGEGLGVDLARWSSAILDNSLGNFEGGLARAGGGSRPLHLDLDAAGAHRSGGAMWTDGRRRPGLARVRRHCAPGRQ